MTTVQTTPEATQPSLGELKQDLADKRQVIDTFIYLGGMRVEQLPFPFASGQENVQDNTVGEAKQRLDIQRTIEETAREEWLEADTSEAREAAEARRRVILEYGVHLAGQIISTVTTTYSLQPIDLR